MFSIRDGVEHKRLRTHMARCFNTDTVTQAIGRLTANVDVAIASVCGASRGSAAPEGATSPARSTQDQQPRCFSRT